MLVVFGPSFLTSGEIRCALGIGHIQRMASLAGQPLGNKATTETPTGWGNEKLY